MEKMTLLAYRTVSQLSDIKCERELTKDENLLLIQACRTLQRALALQEEALAEDENST